MSPMVKTSLALAVLCLGLLIWFMWGILWLVSHTLFFKVWLGVCLLVAITSVIMMMWDKPIMLRIRRTYHWKMALFWRIPFKWSLWSWKAPVRWLNILSLNMWTFHLILEECLYFLILETTRK